MVAIGTLKKNELNEIGFTGTVKSMRQQLRLVSTNYTLNTRRMSKEQLVSKIGTIRKIREIFKQKRIQKSKRSGSIAATA